MDEQFTKELAAMADLGQRRSKVRNVAFFFAYLAAFAFAVGLRALGIRIGVLWIMLACAPIATGVAVAVVRSKTPKLIAAVSEAHGVPADKLSSEQYLIDG